MNQHMARHMSGTGMTRHEHSSVRHAARHGTHMSWAKFRILGIRALKAQHD